MILSDTTSVSGDLAIDPKAEESMRELIPLLIRNLEEGRKDLIIQAELEMIPNEYRNNPRIRRLIKERVERMNPVGLKFVGEALSNRPDLTGDLTNFDVPTLVISGERDGIRRESRIMYEALPLAEWVSIKGAGHVTLRFRSRAYRNSVLNFLERVQKDDVRPSREVLV